MQRPPGPSREHPARARRAWLLAPAALALAGCPSSAQPRSAFPTADDALGRMHATYACANGVQGKAKVDNFSPQGRIKGDLYIFAVNPDRVRFDVVSPFSPTSLYTLTADGQRFEMLDAKENQFLHGPSSPCNLARLTQVPIPGHALVSLLQGESPVLVHDRGGASLAWDPGGFYRLAIQSTRGASEEIHLSVHPDDRAKPWTEQRVRVLDVRVTQAGTDLYHVELGRHEAARTAPPRVDTDDGVEETLLPSGGACEAELPRTIRMRVPNTGQDVIFDYKEAKWNPPIVPGIFQQAAPAGVRQVYVDCER